MNKNQWMAAMYGLDRRDDSMRCRIGAYVHDHTPNPLRVDIMCDVLDYTEIQVRSELARIARRIKKYGIPYELKWGGSQVVSLVPIVK